MLISSSRGTFGLQAGKDPPLYPSLTSTKLCLFMAGFFFMLSKERKSARPEMSASATGLPRNAETRLFVVVDNDFNGC